MRDKSVSLIRLLSHPQVCTLLISIDHSLPSGEALTSGDPVLMHDRGLTPLPVSMHNLKLTSLSTPHLFATLLRHLPALCSCLLDTFSPI